MTEENSKKNRIVLGLKLSTNKKEGVENITTHAVPKNVKHDVVWSKKGSVVVITKNGDTANNIGDSKNSLTEDEKIRRFKALELAETNRIKKSSVDDKNLELQVEKDRSLIDNLDEESEPIIAESLPLHQQNDIFDLDDKDVINSDLLQHNENAQDTDVLTIKGEEKVEFSDNECATEVEKTLQQGIENIESAHIQKNMSAMQLKRQSKVKNLDIKYKKEHQLGIVEGVVDDPNINKACDTKNDTSTHDGNQSNNEKNEGKHNKGGLEGLYRANEEDTVHKKKDIGSKKQDKGKFYTSKKAINKFNPAQLVQFEMESEYGGGEVEVVIDRRSKFSQYKKHKKNQQDTIKPSPPNEKIVKEVIIPDFITVQELALRSSEKTSTIIKELMKLFVIASINDTIDADTAELVVTELGHIPKRYKEEDYIKNLLKNDQDLVYKEDDLQSRAPIVTVMGHVDHGKTSLLDALRSTDVTSTEFGGITQHIGAYKITTLSGREITFLDTPGHEAFTAMRMRGANLTDIVVLVIAADDGIKAQTIEAINHAKSAGVQVIVAVNKIDKLGANIANVKNELLSYDLIPEEMGGNIMVIPISAQQSIGLDKLEDAILLSADLMELKANPKKSASGSVVEAHIDKGRGPVVTLLVQNGTLHCGDLVIAGSSYGRVRVIKNDKNNSINEAGPSTPVEILGLNDAPVAGDDFVVLKSEKAAKELTDFRIQQKRIHKNAISVKRYSAAELFTDIKSGVKELILIIKADVQGSVEAITQNLSKFVTHEARVKIVHYAVGGINESDVALAVTTHAIIVGFNVRINQNAKLTAQAFGVDIRYYSVIYDLLGDIKKLMSGMLTAISKEKIIGYATVKKVFDLSKYGKIAGCYVKEGVIKRNGNVRLLRDNIVIHTGKIKSLKRQKDDVKDIKAGFECGISLENFDNILEQDVLEVFEITEEKREFEIPNTTQHFKEKDNK